jgi:hypothetical protein
MNVVVSNEPIIKPCFQQLNSSHFTFF